MPKQQRARSRLGPINLAEHFSEVSGRATRSDPKLFPRQGHMRTHSAKRMIYTSKATLATTEGTPMIIARPMRIIKVKLNVTGAPSSTLECDLELDGNSIFNSTNRPTILSGALTGENHYPDVIHMPEGAELVIQLISTGSATGPMVVSIDYLDEGA